MVTQGTTRWIVLYAPLGQGEDGPDFDAMEVEYWYVAFGSLDEAKAACPGLAAKCLFGSANVYEESFCLWHDSAHAEDGYWDREEHPSYEN